MAVDGYIVFSIFREDAVASHNRIKRIINEMNDRIDPMDEIVFHKLKLSG